MSSTIAALRSRRASRPVAAGEYRPPEPCRFDFFQGQPDPGVFPLADLRIAFDETFDTEGATACKYQGAGGRAEMLFGYLGLREQLAALIAARDGRDPGAHVHGLMVVNGSSQGLALAVAAFVDPGDGVIMEQASFSSVLGYLHSAGAAVATVPLDRDGMDLDILVARLAEMKAAGHRVKLLYTIPTFQLPTGIVMSLPRRQRLIELAREWDFLIVEDNCYYALHFDDPPPPTLLALDDAAPDNRRVLQSDSFSKTIAPGLRLGWMAGSAAAVQALAAVRQDLGVSQITARAVARYLASGKYLPHVEAARLALWRKRDAGVAALRRHCAPWVRFDPPRGGIYFWLEMSADVDWPRVPLMAAEEGIALRAGELFSADPDSARYLRLAWAHLSAQEIEEGIALLGSVLRRCASPAA